LKHVLKRNLPTTTWQTTWEGAMDSGVSKILYYSRSNIGGMRFSGIQQDIDVKWTAHIIIVPLNFQWCVVN
jgi:hypothetical protein